MPLAPAERQKNYRQRKKLAEVTEKIVTASSPVGALRALSSLIARSELATGLGLQFGSDRDLYKVYGYKQAIAFQDYMARYQRQDIAKRIIEAAPRATWRNAPEIVQIGDKRGEKSEFEKAWDALARRLSIWEYLKRADVIAGIGRYGVLLLGVQGQGALETPLPKLRGPDDIIYLAPFSEGNANILSLEENQASPRFGMPRMYQLDLQRDVTGISQQSSGAKSKLRGISVNVHHSRVIHIAEDLLEDEIFGTPRLRNVFNLMFDLEKVVGGSAEMFWMMANRGIQADIDKEMTMDATDAKNLETEIDDWVHGLRRWIRTRGVTLKPLGEMTPDPRGVFQVLVSLISGATGIPSRILMGSERGELASSQDRLNWFERVEERQKEFAEPRVLRAFIDRLMLHGALPTISEGYDVKWPGLSAMSEEESSKIAARIARALGDYNRARQFGDMPVTIEEFREFWLRVPAIRPESETDETLPPEEDSIDGEDENGNTTE